MSEQIISLNNENKEIELVDCSSLKVDIKNGSNLLLKIVNFNVDEDIKITGEIGKDSSIKVIYADFTQDNVNASVRFLLTNEGAKAEWMLATLSEKSQNKVFDVSFIHEVGHTVASMNNYGVAKDSSKIVFSGVNHIKEHAKESKTSQNAKIIVFDKASQGVASPILKIDENDVSASHGAVVGQLNNEHMFYLMSRGLSKNDAKELIIRGYLQPISKYFSSSIQQKIELSIKEAL